MRSTVVWMHFPIAPFIVAVRFDVLAQRLRRQELAETAHHHLLVAATFTVPAVLSGLAAWQWLLEGHRLKAILLYHLIVALASVTVILLSWWMRNRANEERWRFSEDL